MFILATPPHANMRVRPDIMLSGAKTRALRVAWRNESALVFSNPVFRVCSRRIRRIYRTAAKAANRYIRISPFHTCCKRAETRLSALPLLSAWVRRQDDTLSTFLLRVFSCLLLYPKNAYNTRFMHNRYIKFSNNIQKRLQQKLFTNVRHSEMSLFGHACQAVTARSPNNEYAYLKCAYR